MNQIHKTSGFTSVMASRREPPDSLEFFPTPPFGTRALIKHCLTARDLRGLVWEPAAGAGHMAEVLRESFANVYASDVHDYGVGYPVGSFVGDGFALDRARCPQRPDWLITNPPFNLASEFLVRALEEAKTGVAFFLRLQWLETGDRYREVFHPCPPSTVAIFSERVPLCKGRWDPDGSTATAYAWFIWRQKDAGHKTTRLMWIPPGQREALTLATDRRKFAPETLPDVQDLFEVAR
jgi:hypothetical protein